MVRDERIRQLAIGLGVIAGVAVLSLSLVMATNLPGLAGDFFTRVAGIVTSPFLLEATLAVFGLVVVVLINHWRQHREGDEFVYLDEVKDAPADLPDQARWAVYRDKPLSPDQPLPTDLLEGAVAAGDHEAAMEILGTLSDEELRHPEVIRQRIALARATGKDELARRLESELDA